MDLIFLPSKIKELIEKAASIKDAVTCVRANASLTGKSGEGYMLLFPEKIMLFSREFGMDGYENAVIDITKGLSGIFVRNEKYHSYIDFNTDSKTYTLKFSSLDEKDVRPLLDLIENKNPAVTTAAQATPAPLSPAPVPVQPAEPESHAHIIPDSQPPSLLKNRKISPASGMAAAMMYIAGSDEKFADEEEKCIRDSILNDENVLEKAYEYYGAHTYENLMQDLAYLEHQQALCILANMMEVGMSDGKLESVQQKMIWQFASAMRISEDEYRNFRDVLLVKNQTSILY